MFKRISLFLVSTLLFSVQLFSQIVPPANWGYKLSTTSAKAGDVITIIFTTAIPETFHIYSNDYVCELGPQPSEFFYEKHPSYELVGGAIPVGSHKYEDEIFMCEVADFSKKAEFRQKIKVLAASPVIKGRLDYQMCTEEGMCVLHEYEYSITGLTVTGAEAAPVVQVVPDREPEPDTAEEVVEEVSSGRTTAVSDSLLQALLACQDCASKEVKAVEYEPISKDSVNYSSFKASGPDSQEPCEEKVFPGEVQTKGMYWRFFLLSFISGLLALLTPCVFPMIPMTISFFMKDGQSKAAGRRNGIIYGLSIIGIYTIIGSILSIVVGPDAANWLSTHWLPNVLFFVIFVVFAASFFGAFEITLPSWLVNKVDAKADQGGLIGIFFMAFTIVLVSFSCTGPIVGSILVQSFGGQVLMPTIGMLGFSLAFALPFSLFAIFPSWLSGLPQSGGWLNSVKVVLGFLELALGLKFLSVADQTYHWGILDREVYIALWIVIFTLMGLYLLGKIKFSHDSPLQYLKVPRLFFTIATFTFVMYLFPGMFGAPLSMLAGYLPPMNTHDFNLAAMITGEEDKEGNLCEKPKYEDVLHLPHGLVGYYDYEQGMECARKLGKPVFIDFTGHGCVNCREMEARVWKDKRVLDMLKEDYVIISLYVDDKTIQLPENERYYSKASGKLIKTLAKKNSDIELCYFKANAQPLYALLDNQGELLAPKRNYDPDKMAYIEFLKSGLREYEKRMAPRKLKK